MGVCIEGNFPPKKLCYGHDQFKVTLLLYMYSIARWYVMRRNVANRPLYSFWWAAEVLEPLFFTAYGGEAEHQLDSALVITTELSKKKTLSMNPDHRPKYAACRYLDSLCCKLKSISIARMLR